MASKVIYTIVTKIRSNNFYLKKNNVVLLVDLDSKRELLSIRNGILRLVILNGVVITSISKFS